MSLAKFERLTPALEGALTGLVFGSIEYPFAILEPMFRWGPRALGPEHWYWESVFLVFYVLAGAVTGVIASALPGATGKSIPQAVTGVALAAMAFTRLSSAGLAPATLAVDLSLALLAAFCLRGYWRPYRDTHRAWLSSPWIAIPAALLFVKGGDWTGGVAGVTASIAVLVALIALGTAALSRLAAPRRLLEGRFRPGTLLACALLLTAFAGLTLRLGSPLPLPQDRLADSAASGPNVLLVVLDTVRADHLSLYGYPRRTTPYLEELARESVVYRNAISAADMTLTSYGSIYTSLYPSWHGAIPSPEKIIGLDSRFSTLAETLSSQGYLSMSVLANSGYLNPDFGLQQGFAFYDVRPVTPYLGLVRDHWLRRALRPALDLVLDTQELGRAFCRSDQITAGAIRLLRARTARSAPFFLSVNYMGAHEPSTPPAPYRDSFPGRDREFDAETDQLTRQAIIAGQKSPALRGHLRHIVSQYDAGIAFMDAQVRLLVDYLKQAGIYDRTLLIVTSDHGQAIGERGDYGHPSSVHGELVHVPLLIKYPGSSPAAPGSRVDRIVSGVDLMPTILSAAGIPSPPGIQGRSLFEAADDPGRDVFTESSVSIRNTPIHHRDLQRALYLGPWKLIDTIGMKPELYRWTTDPRESHNLYQAQDPIAQRLDRELRQALQTLPRSKSPGRAMPPGTADRLRGLGYIR
jgi:arylsulfatase A-like enzyme